MYTDPWVVAAAIGTIGSALFVAWQAYETRRAVKAGQRGADLSRVMAIEAVKTRLDSRAPRLNVIAAPTNNEVVYAESTMGGEPQQWPTGTPLQRSRDDSAGLVVGAQFEISNNGDDTVEVSLIGSVRVLCSPMAPHRSLPGVTLVQLRPGEKCEFRLELSQRLAQWADEWDAWRAQGTAGGVAPGSVICSDRYDDGVVDVWDLEVTCFPVTRVDGDLGKWRVRHGSEGDPPTVSALVQPKPRQYYLSKRTSQLLPVSELPAAPSRGRLSALIRAKLPRGARGELPPGK